LDNMTKPRHGKLHLSSDNCWVFCPGNSTDIDKGIRLPDLSATCQTC
jgi:Pyruvate/2-oxoacid:ferredoxin oxidoreductase delta subunit